MKRDMDLIRKIAFAIEDSSSAIDSNSLAIDGFTQEQIAYHCELMNESGLLHAIDVSHLQSKFAEFQINRLTAKGHDFTDAARSDTIWKKATTKIASTVGGVTIDVLIQYLKTQALASLGLSTPSDG
jgi:hypothetical protein